MVLGLFELAFDLGHIVRAAEGQHVVADLQFVVGAGDSHFSIAADRSDANGLLHFQVDQTLARC